MEIPQKRIVKFQGKTAHNSKRESIESTMDVRETLKLTLWMLKELLKQAEPETKMHRMIEDFIYETMAELERLQEQDPE